MTDKIIRVKIEAGDSAQQINQLDNTMTKLGATTDKTTAEITGLNTKLTETASGVKNAIGSTNEALGSFGRSAGQAGIQIQQFVGQVQGGVSPLVALSQQATDLGFVLGFPLLGAVVGVAAAIGGPLISSFIDATDKADEFKKKLEELKGVQDDLKGVNLSIEVSKLNAEYDKQTAEIARLEEEGKKYLELLKQGGSAADAYAVALDGVSLGIKAAKERQAELAKQQEELTKASLEGIATTAEQDDKLSSLNANLELQRIALQEGELQAKLYAAAQYLGVGSVDKLDESVKQQITSLYELAQAQKMQKESAELLQRQVEEELKQEADLFKAEQEKERRAQRERQRFNERVANMQTEALVLQAQTELMQSVRSGQFTQEEADLAAQTASRVLAATNQYNQLAELAAGNREQQLMAEEAYQAQLLAINEQYAQAQIDLKRRQQMQELNAQQAFANSAIQLVAAFGSKSFQAQKNAAIATSIVNITAGVAKALNNPYPANLGFAAQVAAEGAALISTIKSTNINGGASVSFGGGVTATIPTTPQAAPVVGSFEIAGLSDLQAQLDKLDSDEVLPVSFTRRLVASLSSVQRLDGAA